MKSVEADRALVETPSATAMKRDDIMFGEVNGCFAASLLQ
jgi:hypothetical protein